MQALGVPLPAMNDEEECFMCDDDVIYDSDENDENIIESYHYLE